MPTSAKKADLSSELFDRGTDEAKSSALSVFLCTKEGLGFLGHNQCLPFDIHVNSFD